MPLLRPRVLRVLTAAVVGGALAVGCSGAPGASSGSATAAGPVGSSAAGASAVAGPAAVRPSAVAAGVPATFPASGVLRAWDRARAAAFADGDAVALRRLYVPGSMAGTADVRLLRAYLARGLRVEGMRMQVLALDVLTEAPGRLRLRVTDRLAGGAVAVGAAGVRLRLPADAASTRVVVLVRDRSSGVWRVASVRG